MYQRAFSAQPGLARRAASIRNRQNKLDAIKRRIIDLHKFDPPPTDDMIRELVTELLTRERAA